MKTPFSCLRRPALAGTATLLLATLGASHARAQAMLTFTGGNNTALTLTLNAPVTYTITASAGNNLSPFFDFQGVGNVFSNLGVSGTITFTINGGVAQTFTNLNSGVTLGSIAATDAYIFGSEPGVVVGNTVVLQAGTLTTANNFAGAPPASGSYQTFITDGQGNKLDAVNGVSAVPEPDTWTWLLVGVGALAAWHVRRQGRPGKA